MTSLKHNKNYKSNQNNQSNQNNKNDQNNKNNRNSKNNKNNKNKKNKKINQNNNQNKNAQKSMAKNDPSSPYPHSTKSNSTFAKVNHSKDVVSPAGCPTQNLMTTSRARIRLRFFWNVSQQG
ncbi:hypothetical protein BGX24_010842 [Mortierella sp. AD032]|nr:hypothetical protein BGX24_010842 [Mortierella sp. AD032]